MGMGMGMGGSMAGMGTGMHAAPMGSMGGNPSMYSGKGHMAGANAPNPLFNAPPSPLGSQPGGMMMAPDAQPHGSMQGGHMSPHGAATPAPPAVAGADGEAQMMQQLMAEINQLRAELNQN